jgi:hypothetical protein
VEVYKLYPQLNYYDRRQQSIPVSVDRRTGLNRRTSFKNDSNIADRRIDSKLKADIEEIKDVFKAFKPDDSGFTHDVEVGAATTIPYVRRLKSANDAFEKHDYLKGLGIIFLQYLNVKEDWSDLTKIFKKPNTPHDYQIPFSFIRGTPLEKYEFLDKFDKTMTDTKFGKKFLKAIGANKFLYFDTEKYNKLGDPIVAFKAKGNLLSKIAYRTLLRIPVLSFAFVSMLEIPSIIKSKGHFDQTKKSAVNVTLTVFTGALLGAIGAYAGPLGSLAGLGAGSYLGSRIAKKINK